MTDLHERIDLHLRRARFEAVLFNAVQRELQRAVGDDVYLHLGERTAAVERILQSLRDHNEVPCDREALLRDALQDLVVAVEIPEPLGQEAEAAALDKARAVLETV